MSITAPPADIAIPTAGPSSAMVARSFIGRVLFYVLMAVVTVFFALPMLWLVLAPFDATPRLTIKVPLFTLDNFRDPVRQPLRHAVAAERRRSSRSAP